MKTKLKTLLQKSMNKVQSEYSEGRINQSEYELFSHFWDKFYDHPCNCIFCLIESGKKEESYNFICSLSYYERENFFNALRWPEGHNYCVGNYNYYDKTGFEGLQNDLKRIYEHIVNKTLPDYYNI